MAYWPNPSCFCGRVDNSAYIISITLLVHNLNPGWRRLHWCPSLLTFAFLMVQSLQMQRDSKWLPAQANTLNAASAPALQNREQWIGLPYTCTNISHWSLYGVCATVQQHKATCIPDTLINLRYNLLNMELIGWAAWWDTTNWINELVFQEGKLQSPLCDCFPRSHYCFSLPWIDSYT